MTIIENSLFLEKNYKSKSSFSEKNPEIKISTIKTDLKENVVEEKHEEKMEYRGKPYPGIVPPKFYKK